MRWLLLLLLTTSTTLLLSTFFSTFFITHKLFALPLHILPSNMYYHWPYYYEGVHYLPSYCNNAIAWSIRRLYVDNCISLILSWANASCFSLLSFICYNHHLILLIIITITSLFFLSCRVSNSPSILVRSIFISYNTLISIVVVVVILPFYLFQDCLYLYQRSLANHYALCSILQFYPSYSKHHQHDHYTS